MEGISAQQSCDLSAVSTASRRQRPRGRPVDAARRAARRRQVVAAAFTVFSEAGYAGATTAAICRAAGIGSSTLFHYFPTKSAILVAVIEDGTVEAADRFRRLQQDPDAFRALLTWMDEVVVELAEARLAGFVRAVSAVVGEPDVTASLQADDETTTTGLATLIAQAQRGGQVRRDLPPNRLAQWLALLVDGFVGRIATVAAFRAAEESSVLRETALALLLASPSTPRGVR